MNQDVNQNVHHDKNRDLHHPHSPLIFRSSLRRRISWGLLAGAVLLTSACSREESASQSHGLHQPESLLQAVRAVTDDELRDVTITVIDGFFGYLQLKPAGLADTPYRINFINNAGATEQLALLLSGQADLNVFGDISFAGIAAADAPVKVVASLQRPVKSCGIIVPAESPVQDVTGLQGKTIANTSGFSSEVVAIRAFREKGLDFFKSARVVDIKSLADARTAFVSRKVDAWVGCTEIMVNEVLEGHARFIVNGEHGLWSGQNYWGVHDKVFADPRKLAAVLDYIQRTGRSFEWANRKENLPEISRLTAELFHMPVEQALRFRQWSGPTHAIPIDDSVVAGLQATYDEEAAIGRIPAGRKVAPMFTPLFNDYLREAAQR